MSSLLNKAQYLLRHHRIGELLRKITEFALLHIIYAKWYMRGRYNTFTVMKNDKRFNISDRLLHNLLSSYHVSKYEISCISLRNLKREWHNRIMSLNETATYSYIINGEEERYRTYVRTVNEEVGVRDERRIQEIIADDLARVQNTIESVSQNGYDICKSAIVIDDRDVVLDGLHRSSILWKQFGPDHQILALRIYYHRVFR